MTIGPKTFAVVARAASGAYFPPDGFLRARQFPLPNGGTVEILLRTRRTVLNGFDRPVPRGIYAEIRGVAESIYDALQEFTTAAQNLLPVVSLSANAPIMNLQPELAFDATPGREEREYFQQFLLDERLLPYTPRKVHAPATRDLLESIVTSAERDRLLRATAQYFHSLQEWGPGQEIMALVHIFIGMEVLTPVALRHHLAQYHVEKADLVEAWKIDVRSLDPEVRRRLLFDGDDETYTKVRKASDGFEHGFLPFHDIRSTALDLRETAAGYLRRAILRFSGASRDVIALLTSHPYTKPFNLEYTKYLWGILRGKGEELAAPDQDFPIMNWKSTASQKPNTQGPDPEPRFEETISQRLAPGIVFQLRRLEVWGAKPDERPEDQPLVQGDS
jgi:hypothetical protein